MTKDTITPAGLAALTRSAGGKYHARKTWVEELGRWFDSQHEADVAVMLRRREQAGEIALLAFQERYPLHVNGVLVAVYVADFRYVERCPGEYRSVVADAKGYPTPVWKIKKRLMKACHGIDVVEL